VIATAKGTIGIATVKVDGNEGIRTVNAWMLIAPLRSRRW